jgi:signal transduction histidine kinase
MKLPSIVDTISFKLSALYLGLFLVSFLVIGVSVYWLTNQTLEQQLKSSIDIEANRLKSEYDSGGISELKDEIGELDIGKGSHTFFEYGVIDRNGALIAGSFSQFQPVMGWQTIERLVASDAPGTKTKIPLYIKVMALTNDIWLGVGHSGGAIHNAGAAIIQAFLWGVILVIFLGAIGGLYLSRAFLRKIERITISSQTIIAGDLKHRLPVSKNRDELDKLALVLNLMLDKIVALMENIQQVSNDIAHDLRTPISHLKIRLEDALNRNLSVNQYQERITFAIEEVDSILATFSAMLRISQIESGSRRSGFNSVDLSQILTTVTDALHPVAEEEGKTIHAEFGQNVILNGDKELLTQLAFNVLENAIQHTPQNTQIHVSLRKSGNQTALIVADNGSGIAEKDREKVFRRFHRLEQSRTTPGNGLGLSIVSAIVELHGGTITLADNYPGLKVIISFCNQQGNAL